MKILILTQWFDPEPAFKGLLFAKALAARGHEVEVLTGFPNYPGGRIYPGYRIRPWTREEVEGIRITRVALFPSHSNSGLGRVLNYMSFALSAAVFGTALVKKPDVMYVYHPPITVGFAAAVIGFLRRTPFVYDINDLWPDTVAASGMMSNSVALKLLNALCGFVYRCANRIIVISPGLREILAIRGVPRGKMELTYNWCDEVALGNSNGITARWSGTDRFSVLFAGTMGRAQDLETVLEAAKICRETAPSVDFLFIGGGIERPRLKKIATDMQLDNVRFLPPRPISAMGGILAGSDVLLVHLKDDPLFRITIPSKTQAYMAAGKPILMAVLGDAANLITSSDAGVCCQPGNPQSIAAAVKALSETEYRRLAEMGDNGRAFYYREMSVAIGVERIENVMRTAAYT